MSAASGPDLSLLLAEGEGQRIEFKERLSRLDRELVAFANAAGGAVFLGVDDQGRVVGIELNNELKSRVHDIARNCDPPVPVTLRNHREGVLEIRIAEGSHKPHQCREGFFLRNGPNTQKLTRDEIVQIVLVSGAHHFDETINERFRFPHDFAPEKLSRFLELAEIEHRADPQSILASLDVAELEGTTLRFRQAGVLFFAKEPQRFLKESHISAIRYEGTDRFSVLDRAEVTGDPLAMIEETLTFIRRNTRVRQVVTAEARHAEVREYPLIALREAVINAVMHRDYYYDASHIYVHIFSDRIEVETPGGLPHGLRVEDLGSRRVRRNRTIADLLFRAKYVERIGSGIQRMQRALEDNANPPMEISASNFFVVKFHPRVEQTGIMALTARQGELCRHLSDRGALTKSEASRLLGVSGDTALRELQALMRAGVVERRGVGRATRYVLVRDTRQQ